MSKFDNVPIEEDTAILFSTEATLDDFDVLYQKWYWDGIEAESIIFVADDINNMNDNALKSFVSESPLVEDPSMTIARDRKGFTFVNFNFKSQSLLNL